MSINEVVQGMDKFAAVLMKDNRELFQTMLADLNIEALDGLGLGKEPFELVAMTLIFEQQEKIAGLLEAIARWEKEQIQ